VSRYITYNPEQVWLLPPGAREELGEGHLAVFVHEAVERLDMKQWEDERADQGSPGDAPQLMLKIWLYACMPGIASSRRIEQRVQEDRGFRLLAGNLKPDHWTLNQFRKRHPKGLNDIFTQVVEAARNPGMGKPGVVAIDSTRVKASASPDRGDSIGELRAERARIRQRIRRWQKQCDCEAGEPVPVSMRRAGSKGWKRFRGNWSNCANRVGSVLRAAIRRADICVSETASVWVMPPRSRFPAII
jgi:transposase